MSIPQTTIVLWECVCDQQTEQESGQQIGLQKDGGNQQGNEEEDRALQTGDNYCTPFDKKT